MDGERTRLATFQSRPAGKQPRKVLADILRAGEAAGGGGRKSGWYPPECARTLRCFLPVTMLRPPLLPRLKQADF